MPDGVRIDTDAVGDVARGIRAEADSGLAATADRGATLHRQGVQFGARLTPSATVTEAKQRYALALANTEANLRAYRAAARALADAADQIARLLASADLSAAQVQRRVRDVIDRAVP